MNLNLAWIGTGHIHTPGFISEVLKRNVTCAGVWDHDVKRAETNAVKLGGIVRTIEELIAESNIDGFVICSETKLHLELVEKIAPTKKPIFIEKPMGFNGEQSQAILKIFNEFGNTFQTGYFTRGQSQIQTLKKMVEEGKFGQVTRVRGNVCHSGAINGWFDGEWRWMADRSQSGVGAFGDLGTHALDVLMWIFGDIEAATGQLDKGTNRYPGCEETGEGLFRFKNGIIGTLSASWDDVSNPTRFHVYGTKGLAIIDSNFMFAGTDGKLEKLEELEPEVSGGFPAYLDFLEGKSVTLVAASEAAKRDAVMSAIYKGAESLSWIKI